tara:strand:- start:725 stop:1021 length:297 start_codon:yes stop_codon:yes gene_type:complete
MVDATQATANLESDRNDAAKLNATIARLGDQMSIVEMVLEPQERNGIKDYSLYAIHVEMQPPKPRDCEEFEAEMEAQRTALHELRQRYIQARDALGGV